MANSNETRTILEGPLEKVSKFPRTTKVWTVLTDTSLMLFKENKRSSCIGSVELEEIRSIERVSGRTEHMFDVTTVHKSMVFMACSESECQKWIDKIKRAAAGKGGGTPSNQSGGMGQQNSQTAHNEPESNSPYRNGSIVGFEEPVVLRKKPSWKRSTQPRIAPGPQTSLDAEVSLSKKIPTSSNNGSSSYNDVALTTSPESGLNGITSRGHPTDKAGSDATARESSQTVVNHLPSETESVVMRNPRLSRGSTTSAIPVESAVLRPGTIGDPKETTMALDKENCTIEEMDQNHNDVFEDESEYDDILSLEPLRSISPLPYGVLSNVELEPLNELKEFLLKNFDRGSHHINRTGDAVVELKEFISSLI
ncbi:hypothetical protein ScPMuIL_005095 [Solemya velum]